MQCFLTFFAISRRPQQATVAGGVHLGSFVALAEGRREACVAITGSLVAAGELAERGTETYNVWGSFKFVVTVGPVVRRSFG